jgi:hypothetical protein
MWIVCARQEMATGASRGTIIIAMETWGAAQWWSLWLTLAGALATTGAAVWAYVQATAHKDDLAKRRHERRKVFQRAKEEMDAAHDRIISAGIGSREERDALAAEEAAIDAQAEALANELIPDDGVTWSEAGLATHFATVAMVANEIAAFRRQGWLLLLGVWMGAGGSIVGLFAT